MAIYQVTVHKRFVDPAISAQRWSNVYYVDVASVEDALDLGEVIADLEMAVSKDYVQSFVLNAIQPGGLGASGRSRAFVLNGSVGGDLSVMLPLFNTVRVTFDDGTQRPSQKYLRLPLEEGDVTNGALDPSTVSGVQATYATPLTGVAGVVGNEGGDLTNPTTLPQIQMRQLGWHRRSRPGFHRGYVAD